MPIFTATTMQEALFLVQQALGEDALIVETRTVDADATGVKRIEVFAEPPAAQPEYNDRENPSSTAGEEPTGELTEYLRTLSGDIRAVHNRLEGLATSMPWLGSGFSNLPQGELTEYLVQGVANRLPMSGGIHPGAEQHVVALIGPNGVGKSTMIAKLCWRFSVEQHCHVGVISTDTVKIGGATILQVICAHLNIPFEIVYQPEAMPETLQRLSACTLILIDTPGGSQRNEEHLADVQSFLHYADPAEVHLVLSASMNPSVIREVLYRTAHFQPDQVILTKLDEASTIIDVLPLFFGTGLALSYLGTGPALSGELKVASPMAITGLFTEG